MSHRGSQRVPETCPQGTRGMSPADQAGTPPQGTAACTHGTQGRRRRRTARICGGRSNCWHEGWAESTPRYPRPWGSSSRSTCTPNWGGTGRTSPHALNRCRWGRLRTHGRAPPRMFGSLAYQPAYGKGLSTTQRAKRIPNRPKRGAMDYPARVAALGARAAKEAI